VNIVRYYEFVKAMAPQWSEDGSISYDGRWIPLPLQWEAYNQEKEFRCLPVDPSRPYVECYPPVALDSKAREEWLAYQEEKSKVIVLDDDFTPEELAAQEEN
jgi:hypothetical protein